MGAGRPVRNADEMAFDYDGDDYLDPAEEAELERYLDEDEDDDDDDFDEDLEEDEDDWDLDDEDDFDGDDW